MAYLSDDELLDTEGGFTGWDDGTGAGAEETLEQALAEERLAELENELEQDEHPIDYEAELEDEEEEAAPVSDKRLKREMRAEAIRRLEEAARTEKDFRAVVEELSEEHKEVLYFLSLRLYSTTRLAAVRGQSDRNIRKLRKTIHKKLQRQMYDHLCGKQEHGGSLTLRERQFLEEYSKIARKQGKDAVIRRENKTKRRKKKNRP